jgi:hypothetical protein
MTSRHLAGVGLGFTTRLILAAAAAALAAEPGAARAGGGFSGSDGVQVKLVRAQKLLGDPSPSAPDPTRFTLAVAFDVVVQNIAFQKQVFVRMKDPCGGPSTIDVQGSFVQLGDSSGNNELWRVGIDLLSRTALTRSITFVVGYRVAGQTYWDTNDGRSYVLDLDGPVNGALLANGTHVLLQHVAGQFNGVIHLQNLSAKKTVNVVYTTDHWSTQHTVGANRVAAANPNGVEAWAFSADLQNASSVEFAVSYQVNGQTFWDNNFTHNYVASFSRSGPAASGANGAGVLPLAIFPAKRTCS